MVICVDEVHYQPIKLITKTQNHNFNHFKIYFMILFALILCFSIKI